MSSINTSSTMSLISTNNAYKGKFTRSWHQLPPEIIRQIATHYLLDLSASSYCPETWEARGMWPNRLVYTAIRDARELECRLMPVCPSWASALEDHLYWQQACAVIDPNDCLANFFIPLPPPQSATSNVSITSFRPSPWRHFRNLTNHACIVCRINHPFQNYGLNAAKRIVNIPFIGSIHTCREHRKTMFCGVCLREAPALDTENDFNLICCADNEDEDTWPHVESTCRSCRMEFMWERVRQYPDDIEAIGGRDFTPPDWEARQSVEAFLDLGEGTINDVLSLARDKHWLRRNTKLSDMLSQAVAATRYDRTDFLDNSITGPGNPGNGGYGSEGEASEDDDVELMSVQEDSGVREIAIADWARNRILDGFWISPADQWYGHVNPGPRANLIEARHPCPWNRGATYDGALEDGERGDGRHGVGAELRHPRPKTTEAKCPPSFQLCEQTYRAFQRQMRDILLPAMGNIVRRIVMESAADDVDPTLRITPMSLEEVARELRDEAVWYNGIDWLERRANRVKEEQERQARLLSNSSRREIREGGEGDARNGEDDDSSTSSRSDASSHTTSPVLSTTTLQTTPSPPPTSGDTPTSVASNKDDDSDTSSPVATTRGMVYPIAVQPTLKAPKLIHPIPYVPETLGHLPYYSMDAFRLAWREACAPLYQCRCSICERAIMKANIEAGHVPPQVVPSSNPNTSYPHTQPNNVVPETPRQPNQIQESRVTSESSPTPVPKEKHHQVYPQSQIHSQPNANSVPQHGKVERPVTIQIEEAREEDDVYMSGMQGQQHHQRERLHGDDIRGKEEEEEEEDGDESDSIIDDSSDEVEGPVGVFHGSTLAGDAGVGGGAKSKRLPLPRSNLLAKAFPRIETNESDVPSSVPAAGRKRPSKELDVDVDDDAGVVGEEFPYVEVESNVRESGRETEGKVRMRSGSPPKRVRVDGSFSEASTPGSTTVSSPPSGTATISSRNTTPTIKIPSIRGFESPSRLRKRSSEEREDDLGGVCGNGESKRQRSESMGEGGEVLLGGFVIRSGVNGSAKG